MKIALAQINPIVGDIKYNTEKIIDFILTAKLNGADLVVFPELAITGYPPEDLVLKPQFVLDNLSALEEIVKQSYDIAVCIGFINQKHGNIFNAGVFINDSKIKGIYHKMNLPNYGVFDEKRYFKEGDKPLVVSFNGIKIGLSICEDIWVENGPYKEEAKNGAKIILNLNASPYNIGKTKERENILRKRSKALKTTIVYVNMVGGQDELVFDGGSMVFNPSGKKIACANQFKEELLFVALDKEKTKANQVLPQLDSNSEIYEALVLATRDYVVKNRFSEVLIGLSGGIDSALTLLIAVDALGKDKVHAIFMPSQYTSEQSRLDAKKLCKNIDISLIEIPINEVFDSFLDKLTPNFNGKPLDITEENLQARIRGIYLMALSNKFGFLVLTTGNKSEMSTGYCTLYGDMSGGFAVIKDIPKTLVYKLTEWRNKQGEEIIPQSIIKRPPTAELKTNQKDQDTLPPYEILDSIIKAYVEENKSFKQIISRGFDEDIVRKVLNMIDFSEYKRRQAPPGPRITSRSFGKDWRLPITNHYRDKTL